MASFYNIVFLFFLAPAMAWGVGPIFKQGQSMDFGLGTYEPPERVKEKYPGEHGTQAYKDKMRYSPRPSSKRYQKVNVLTIDTRDRERCPKFAKALFDSGSIGPKEFEHFCKVNPEKPLISVAVVDGYATIGFTYSRQSRRGQELYRRTGNFFGPASAMMAILWALPKSLTGWEEFNASEIGNKYISNIQSGPEIEDNEWWINWIGHPYAGAAYYVVARHAGFSTGESFLYSAFMSTFFWEYGIEALSEVPSIQDLIITPIFGSLLGEAFIMGENHIRNSEGRLWGSKTLGNIALVLFDPAGGLLEATDRLFVHSPFVDSRASIGIGPSKSTGSTELRFAIDLYFRCHKFPYSSE